ncbi:hypothetical protein [Alteromonas sp. a30]|uniref:hypothetical protein n=1 Tax=Alteromonas sp. a30 TaxID=2730917 RepID=UPI0022800A7E|nr:hypothetical protein [Alteromonas sp. a30]MCY7296239.1 hypothetical protein [Alteromonas sp. a30]
MSLNGRREFDNIISPKGLWKVDFVLGPKLLPYFSTFSEGQLALLLKENFKHYIVTNYHHNPFYYLELYLNIFKKGGHSHDDVYRYNSLYQRKTNITFCPSCIKECLKANGFGYFKSEWQINQKCEIHGTSLYFLPESSRQKAIDSIRTILLGEVPASASGYISSGNSSTEERRTGHITPCLFEQYTLRLRNALKSWDIEKAIICNESHFHVMKNAYDNLFYANSGFPKQVPHSKISVLLDYLVTKGTVIGSKITSIPTEVIEVLNGIDDSTSCSEDLVAPVERSCSKCKYSKQHCALSPHIELFRFKQNRFQLIPDNYCERVDRNVIRRGGYYEPFIPYYHEERNSGFCEGYWESKLSSSWYSTEE